MITINNASNAFREGNFYDMMCVLLHEQDHYDSYNPYTYNEYASEFFAFGATIYNEYFLSSRKTFTASTNTIKGCTTIMKVHIPINIIKYPAAMYKRIFLFLCFCLSFQLSAQKKELRDEFTHNLLKTFDVLHIADNPDNYLISKSPLSHFKGYRTIYSDTVTIFGDSYKLPYEAEEGQECEVRIMILQSHTFLPFGSPFGSEGNSEKDYIASWLLLNTQLYLSNVIFPFEARDDKIVFSPMEKFTRKRFNRKSLPDIEKRIYGLMPATWFTDTLYVKKANSGKEPLDRDVWQKKHYLRMIFNKGKLVSTEVVANKTWIETVWPSPAPWWKSKPRDVGKK